MVDRDQIGDEKRKGVVDVVKWLADDNEIAWRYPSSELSTWTQLIVAESQEAMLVHEGQMEGPFAAGRHTLSTENLPVLRDLIKLPFGKRSPFTSEVWFVNRSIPLDIRWEFNEPLLLNDPEHNVILPVMASGQYGVAVEHSKQFLVQMVGTKKTFERDKLHSYLQGIVLTRAKALIARSLVDKKTSILNLPAQLSEISDSLKREIDGEVTKYGLRVDSFFVTTVGPIETDKSVESLRSALSAKRSREIQGITYQQERSLDVLEKAASNEGTAGGVMGAGIGLGMGLNVGNAVGGAMSGVAKELSGAPNAAPPGKDRLAVLRELAQMHKDGVLTDEEFAREKQRVLSAP
jgi:membrane protease subunit (stomatin/prohibitin family)